MARAIPDQNSLVQALQGIEAGQRHAIYVFLKPFLGFEAEEPRYFEGEETTTALAGGR